MAAKKYKPLSPKSKILLAEKRRAASILRSAGLLRRKAGQKITREYLQESSYFRKLRREFADVISGEVRVAKLNRDAASMFKAAGYRVKRASGGKVAVIVQARQMPGGLRKPSPLLPPPAPPVAPRPAKARAAPATSRAERRHRIDDCIKKVLAWFRVNALADVDERAVTLVQYAQQHPTEFRAIINASHNDGARYLSGQGPDFQQTLPDNDIADLFRENFPELYYYHPSYATYTVHGGNLPRC